MLLERRFPNLQDHVLTAVDVAAVPAHAAAYHPQLVSQTSQAADAAVADIHVSDSCSIAARSSAPLRPLSSLAISIGVFAIFSRDVFGFWLERIALSEEPWPRRVHLEVVGFPPDAAGQRTHKLAQDDDFELLVHANTDGYQVPDEVEIRFRLADGRRGRDTLIRVGDADCQPRRLSALPLRIQARRRRHGIRRRRRRRPRPRFAPASRRSAGAVRDRTRMRLSRVPEPRAAATCPSPAACEFPKARGSCFTHLDQAAHRRPHSRLERQTRYDAQTRQRDAAQKLRWDYGTLTDDDVLIVSVTDTDGVASREPYRVSLAVVRDEVPQVAVRLSGISTAITPDAVLPFVGKITDDYGLDRAWFEYQVDATPAATKPLSQQPERPAGAR